MGKGRWDEYNSEMKPIRARLFSSYLAVVLVLNTGFVGMAIAFDP